MRRFVLALVLVLIAASVPGCAPGDARYNTRGRVIQGGKPLAATDGQQVEVVFYAQTADGKMGKNSYYATYDNADGTFTAVGPDGRGLPPGKYRIAVELTRGTKDGLKGAFDALKSPLCVEITADTGDLVLDLDERKVK